jgi:hypothetical protein
MDRQERMEGGEKSAGRETRGGERGTANVESKASAAEHGDFLLGTSRCGRYAK